MIQAVARLWRNHRALFVAICVTALLTVVFAVRLTFRVVYWSQHQEAMLEGWMTVGYVARSYGVERDALAAAVGVGAGERVTLDEIARRSGRPLPEVEASILAAIARARSDGQASP